MERALQVFSTLNSQGMSPDIVTYSALLNGCEKAKQAAGFLEVFQAM